MGQSHGVLAVTWLLTCDLTVFFIVRPDVVTTLIGSPLVETVFLIILVVASLM